MTRDPDNTPFALRERASFKRMIARDYRRAGELTMAATCLREADEHDAEANRQEQSATESVGAAILAFVGAVLVAGEFVIAWGLMS